MNEEASKSNATDHVHVGEPAEQYLEFLLSHFDPRFESDTNVDVGEVLVALAYPVIVIAGPGAHATRREVDVRQPAVEIEEDCYPLKQFLERFPLASRLVVEAHEELSSAYERWSRKSRSRKLQSRTYYKSK